MDKEIINEDAVFLRTVLNKDVHERLKQYALSLRTGLGHWDFGVAIERLLHNESINSRIGVLEERVNQLETELLQAELEQDNNNKEQSEKEKYGLLGKKN